MRIVGAGLFLCAVLAISPAQAETVYGGAAGNGGDGLDTTFHFQSQNIDVRLTKPDGASLSQAEVPSAYGLAYKICSGGEDWVSRNGLQLMGADLSAANWTSAGFPPLGQVAIDPANGRFKFAAPNWQAPVRLNPAASNVTVGIYVAINDRGQALCTRTERGTAWHRQAVANAYDPATGWQGPVPIDPGGNSVDGQAYVVLNNSGLGLCIFRRYESGQGHVFLNTYQAGTGWQGAVRADLNPAYTYSFPRGLVLNDAGYGALFFEAVNGIYVRNLDPVTGWSASTALDINANPVQTADAAISSTGHMACVFLQNNGVYNRLYASRYEPAGSWTPGVVVDAGTGQDAKDPSVAVNSSGMIACLFNQESAGTSRQYVNLYLPGSGWQGAVTVDTIANTYTAIITGENDILVQEDGRVICAFPQFTGYYIELLLREYRPGLGWQAPYALATVYGIATGWVVAPRLASSGQGRMLCGFTFVDFGTSTYTPAFREYQPATGWGPLSYIGSINAIMMSLDMNAQGMAVAGLKQDPTDTEKGYGSVYRVESPAGPVTVNYSYRSLTTTPAPVTAKRVEVTGRELKPLQNRKATIAFDLDQDGWVSINIYNLRGDRVRTLTNQYYASGRYAVDWGGENDAAQLVASGVYIIYVKTPGLEKKQKVVVVK